MMYFHRLTKLRTRNDILSYLTLFPGIEYVAARLRTCRSLIDVGCGDASWIRFIAFPGPKVGIDGWEPAIRRSQERAIHDTYRLSDIRHLELATDSTDAVLCLDVIEHFTKAESVAVLDRIEPLARRLVVVVTPNGFVAQEPLDGNDYQRHLCGWTVRELRDRGYRVYGIEGWKQLRGEYGRIARSPRALWWFVSKLSEVAVWWMPERAFALLAIKSKPADAR